MKIQQILLILFILTIVLQLYFIFGTENEKAYNILYWIQLVLVLVMLFLWIRENNNTWKNKLNAQNIISYVIMFFLLFQFFWRGSNQVSKIVNWIQYVLVLVWGLLYIQHNNHWRNWTILSLLILFVVLGETKEPNKPDKARFYATLVILILMFSLVVVQARIQMSKKKPQQQQKKKQQKSQTIK